MRRVWQGDQIKINNLALACPGIVLHANIAFTDLDHTQLIHENNFQNMQVSAESGAHSTDVHGATVNEGREG